MKCFYVTILFFIICAVTQVRLIAEAPAPAPAPAPTPDPAAPAPDATAPAAAPAQAPEKTYLRFHSGTLLSAELMADNLTNLVVIKNIDKFVDKTLLTAFNGYALLVIRPDQGRSLSIYDYVLCSKDKVEFPCIGVAGGDSPFDGSIAEIPNTLQGRLYALLFRVQMPPADSAPELYLRYKLFRGANEDLLVPFEIASDRPFSKVSSTPEQGKLKFPKQATPAAPDTPATPATPETPATAPATPAAAPGTPAPAPPPAPAPAPAPAPGTPAALPGTPAPAPK